MLSPINAFLSNKSRGFVASAGWLLVLLAGVIDYAAGTDVYTDCLYVLPIAVVSWYVSKEAGFATAIFATLVFAITDEANRQFSLAAAIAIWNALVELGFFLMIVLPVSTLKRYTLRLEAFTTQDPLTTIGNRRAFTQAAMLEIHRSLRHAAPFSVAYIDIDNFKAVNDTQGHNVGDALLRQVALTIQQYTRELDTVARLGGDEFAILFADVAADGAQQAMERIHSSLLAAMQAKDWPVTFSIGVVSFSTPPASVDAIVERVDHVMYAMKHHGKNGIGFEAWPTPEASHPAVGGPEVRSTLP